MAEAKRRQPTRKGTDQMTKYHDRPLFLTLAYAGSLLDYGDLETFGAWSTGISAELAEPSITSSGFPADVSGNTDWTVATPPVLDGTAPASDGDNPLPGWN